jgi:hypothetical protein
VVVGAVAVAVEAVVEAAEGAVVAVTRWKWVRLKLRHSQEG